MDPVTCPNCGRTRPAPDLKESLSPAQLGPYCCCGCAIGLECTCVAEDPELELGEESPLRNSLLEEPRVPFEDQKDM